MRRKSGRFKLRPTGPRGKEVREHNEGPRVSVVVKGKSRGYEMILNRNNCAVRYVHMTLFHDILHREVHLEELVPIYGTW
jgi:hypothetical protein